MKELKKNFRTVKMTVETVEEECTGTCMCPACGCSYTYEVNATLNASYGAYYGGV